VERSAEPLTSHELARLVSGDHHGRERVATTIASPTMATPNHRDAVVVLPHVDDAALAAAGAGGVAIVVARRRDDASALAASAERAGVGLVLVDDPRRALARLSQHFDRRPLPSAPGVHPSAVVASDAELGERVRIGPGCVIGGRARLGDDVVLGPRCTVGEGSSLGAGSVLFDGVVLYDGVHVGARARLHAGVVIGSDGLGYAFGPRGAEKIHHLGGVRIGDDVEIGAQTAIDRGTLDDTRIGDRVKIDNLCQIAHNVIIGDDVVVAGLSGMAGSSRLGDRVIVGGGSLVADHVTIESDARLAGGSGATKRVPAGETWGGVPAQPFKAWVRERYLVGLLERIWTTVRAFGPRS
jgi:UDP-3-O-[3-hydroxymyristoyl] glucosamine N-acyltransferase